ncbi:hypothetical protein ACSBR2_035714 [Camellia fascicularis]
MPLQSRKSSDTIMFLDKAHSARKPNKRLRKTFRVIYFVVSLAKKVIANGKNTQFLPRFSPCPSDVAIDIQAIDDVDDNHDHVCLFDIQKALSKMVREKKQSLSIWRVILSTESTCLVRTRTRNHQQRAFSVLSLKHSKTPPSLYICNFKQSRQFDKLSDESSDLMKVEVVRKGHRQPISIFEVVVGDIVCLKIGDQVPADGLFLDGHSLKVDESSMTGKIVLLIQYFTGNTEDKLVVLLMNAVVRIVAVAVTMVVMVIPEGLPLAATLTLAYSMKTMMVENSMVRKLSACETMGSAMTLCTDKTGTLTLNQMKVTEFWLGKEVMTDKASLKIAPNVLEMLHEGVGLNTTGEVYRQLSTSIPGISGSPTESAILSWVVFDLAMDIDELKKGHEFLQVEAFNSEKK